MTMPPTRHPWGITYVVKPDADGVWPTQDELRGRAVDNVVAARKAASPGLVEADRRYVQEVAARVAGRWGIALDSLEALIVEADDLLRSEWGGMTDEAESWTAKSKALTSLLRRCCVTAREMLVLLHGGLSWGAQGRWRTLNELSITAMFISACDESIAEQYLEWRAVETWKERKELRSAQASDQICGAPALDAGADAEIERKYREVVGRYGKQLTRNDWGWAAPVVQGTPNFRALEEAVTATVLKKQAQFAVHASPGASFWNDDPTAALRFPTDGPSLVAPGWNATRELKRAFMAYGDHAFRVGTLPSVTLMRISAFMALCDGTLEDFAVSAGVGLPRNTENLAAG